MSEVAMREKYWWEHYPLHKVWCNDACPLVPRFHFSKGDKWNSNNWSLHWLIFHFWSLEHFAIGIDAQLSSDDIYVGAILLYLRITIGIRHTHYEWQSKLGNLLRRKPAIREENDDTQ
jgi:hypothetical protein